MASVAKYRDDLNGSITTAGTSTAYTVTSNQGMALTAGYMVAFVPHTTNAATVTIDVDSLGAKPLRSAPGVELPAGAIVEGTPYAATYYTSNSGEWVLHGFYGNPYSIPLGGLMPYVGATAPNSSFVLPYGQAISRTTYSDLFALCSTAFGSGDGSTTFNVPDLRGRTVFGKRDMGGTDSSRITVTGSGMDGSVTGTTGGVESVTLTSTQVPATALSINTVSLGTISVTNGGSQVKVGGSGDNLTGGGINHQAVDLSVTIPDFTPTGTVSGGGALHTNMPPTIIMPYILRVI
jgi:microcystin-dependent protein